jgi:hypothetical protein
MRRTLADGKRQIGGSFGAFRPANGHSMGSPEPRKRAALQVRDHLAWA